MAFGIVRPVCKIIEQPLTTMPYYENIVLGKEEDDFMLTMPPYEMYGSIPHVVVTAVSQKVISCKIDVVYNYPNNKNTQQEVFVTRKFVITDDSNVTQLLDHIAMNLKSSSSYILEMHCCINGKKRVFTKLEDFDYFVYHVLQEHRAIPRRKGMRLFSRRETSSIIYVRGSNRKSSRQPKI